MRGGDLLTLCPPSAQPVGPGFKPDPAAVSVQAGDRLEEVTTTAPTRHRPPKVVVDDGSSSVRTVRGGLPGLGRRR